MTHGIITIDDAINWGCSLNRGLVAWWLALPDQQRGVMVRDLCGRHHGTLTNGPLWVGSRRPGGFGAVSFDGSNDEVQIPVSGSLAMNNNAHQTIMCWALSTESSTPRRGAIELTAGANGHFSIGQRNGNITAILTNFGTVETAVAMPIGTPCHLALVYDGQYRFYLNGSEVHVESRTGINAVYNKARIGSMLSDEWLGQIDDARVYNRALPAHTISAIYQDSHQGYPNTLNWYRRPLVSLQDAGGGGAILSARYLSLLGVGI